MNIKLINCYYNHLPIHFIHKKLGLQELSGTLVY